MYPQVRSPRKVTGKWLNQAFAPLKDYLNKHYPDEVAAIMPWMSFSANENQLFHYRNCRSKGSIVLDQAGNLVSCASKALQYEWDDPEPVKVVRTPWEERIIHPTVTRWMDKRLDRNKEKRFGDEICTFLQEYWGPLVNFDFDDMKVSYPLSGSHPPYCLYMYPMRNETKVAIQFVGDEIVERDCSYAQYQKYTEKERNLIWDGWHVITVYREALDEDPEFFKLYLTKRFKWGSPGTKMKSSC